MFFWTMVFFDLYKKRIPGGGLGMNGFIREWAKKGLLAAASVLTKMGTNVQQ